MRFPRVLRNAGVVAGVGAALVLILLVGVSLCNVLFGLISIHMILDKDDGRVLAVPRGDTLYMRLVRDVGVFSAPGSGGRRLFNLTPRAVVYTLAVHDGWTRIAVYGWVWKASFTERDSVLVLADSLRSENLRANANGIRIGRMLPGAELAPLFVSDKQAWYFCRTSGWVLSRALTGADPGRFWSGMYPVETDFRGLGGELAKRDRLKNLYYREVPFLTVFVPLGCIWLAFWLRRRRRHLRASGSRNA